MTDLATETTSPADGAAEETAAAGTPVSEPVPGSAEAAAEAEAIANGDQVKVVPADSNGSSDPQRSPAQVKGRIEIEDEVVEKVAALSAIEVEGVADLGGDIERAVESVRERIGITVDDVVMPEKFNHSTQAQQREQRKIDRSREQEERYLPID